MIQVQHFQRNCITSNVQQIDFRVFLRI